MERIKGIIGVENHLLPKNYQEPESYFKKGRERERNVKQIGIH